jgi:hypothetical protein
MRATMLRKRYAGLWEDVYEAMRSDIRLCLLSGSHARAPREQDVHRLAHNAAFTATAWYHRTMGGRKVKAALEAWVRTKTGWRHAQGGDWKITLVGKSRKA